MGGRGSRVVHVPQPVRSQADIDNEIKVKVLQTQIDEQNKAAEARKQEAARAEARVRSNPQHLLTPLPLTSLPNGYLYPTCILP
jgi:hypothetical protein